MGSPIGWATRNQGLEEHQAPADILTVHVFYLLFAAVMAAVLIGILLMRHRPSNDPAKSVDSFQRARQALDPERNKKVTVRRSR